jgi:hypothetical protein
MNKSEADAFISNYFFQLFTNRNLDALDGLLHRDYRDDDIGEGDPDHIGNSKKYLRNLFEAIPTIGVDVKSTAIEDDVITAHLEWHKTENGRKVALKKGIGIFVMKDGSVLKRHNYMYYDSSAF